MALWKWIFLLTCALASSNYCQAEERYDFRNSAAYKALSLEDRRSLEQVDRDFVLLWGALDMYAQDHDHKAPASLDNLVPRYLLELPSDPFATKKSAAETETGRYTKSKEGFGYRYEAGPGDWFVISSVGLKDFEYRNGNIGLFRVRGINFGSGWVGIGR
jgi:hypothetical protein